MRSKRLPTKATVRRELKALVGDVETPDEIIRASEWLDSIQCDRLSDLKDDVWMDQVNMDNDRFFRIWDEISFYRIIGEPTAFVVPGWVSTDRGFDELCLLGERWAFLAAENALSGLESHEEIQQVKENGGSLAQRLKAYLKVHKKLAGFEKWTEEHMSDARYRVIKVYEAYLEEKQRPLSCFGFPKNEIVKSVSERIPPESAALHQLFGKIISAEEISKAAKYSDPIGKADRGQAQKAAFTKYVRESCNFKRVFAEIEMYRLVGESSTYFISGQDRDNPMIEELSYVVRDWVILESRGSSILLSKDSLEGDSVAARLKRYMGIYESLKEIERWTEENLNGMRVGICQALAESVDQNYQVEGKSQAADSQFNSRKRFGDGHIPVTPSPTKRLRDASSPSSTSSHLTTNDFSNQRRSQQSTTPPQSPINFGDRNPGWTKNSHDASPVTPKTPRTTPLSESQLRERFNDILNNFEESERIVVAKEEVYLAASVVADQARKLMDTNNEKLAQASDQFAKDSQTQGMNLDRMQKFMTLTSQIDQQMKHSKDLVGKEMVAKEELDAAKQQHKTWKMRMEALELVIDDPKISAEVVKIGSPDLFS